MLNRLVRANIGGPLLAAALMLWPMLACAAGTTQAPHCPTRRVW
jgi:hypothetical protein